MLLGHTLIIQFMKFFLLEIEKIVKNFDNFSIFHKKFPKIDYY